LKRYWIILVAALLLSVIVGGSVFAQSGNTWNIQYFNNLYLTGNPVFTQTAIFLSFNWGTAAPGPGMPAENWSARMTTTAFFYGGTYQFTVLADDAFTLRVNNVIFLNTIGAPQPGKVFTVNLPMTQGFNTIQIDYQQLTSTAFIRVDWSLIGGNVVPFPPFPSPTPTVPPGQVLQPPIGDLTTQYGNYTSCAQQRIHQINCFQPSGQWNSVDAGSITIEPPIILWKLCTADTRITQQVFSGMPAQQTKCSKTGAGYFLI
jgi:hypothetical protein